ncbi:hypothetical protein ABPG74_004637 [Tetrahymena malaccensis]
MNKSIWCLTLVLLFLAKLNCQVVKNTDLVQSLTAYNKWRSSNQRQYLNEDEKIFRQAIFLENFEKIQEFNKDSSKTYEQVLNQFSDMTQDEFIQKVLNPVLSDPKNTTRAYSSTLQQAPQNYQIPDSKDWRVSGAVTPVKNQGSCGSCWAFAASGVMESFNYIQYGQLKSFSEQQLVDCATPNRGYNSYGCQGGYPEEALSYSKNFGILQSNEYPYVGFQGNCKVQQPTTTGYYPKEFGQLTNTIENLKWGISFSPISVLVDATNWSSYGSGVFNNCDPYVRINHAVLAVGYDRQGNWIIKNSWGTQWGQSGYMTLAAGNKCGILTSNCLFTEHENIKGFVSSFENYIYKSIRLKLKCFFYFINVVKYIIYNIKQMLFFESRIIQYIKQGQLIYMY